MKYSLFLLFIPYILFSQKLTKDDEVKQYVSQVNEDSLKSYIGQLVNFQTRHTLSSVTDPHQGIGAARNWVIKKFKDYAKKSGGSMEVYLQQEDLQPDGKRIDKAVNLGNAVAFLKGKDPDDNRVFLIGAHLDSRVTDVMNRTSVAREQMMMGAV